MWFVYFKLKPGVLYLPGGGLEEAATLTFWIRLSMATLSLWSMSITRLRSGWRWRVLYLVVRGQGGRGKRSIRLMHSVAMENNIALLMRLYEEGPYHHSYPFCFLISDFQGKLKMAALSTAQLADSDKLI